MSDEMSIRTPTYRVPRSRGMDPATRRLALIAVVLGAALFAVVGAWSVVGHRSSAVPVIAPQAGPIRVKPANPGGMQVANASSDLFSGGDSAGAGDGKLAPPPEVPDPQALRAPPAPPPARAKPTQLATPPEAAKAPTAAASVQPPPAATAPAATTPVAAAKPASRAPAATGEPILVQLAALPTEQAAKDEWALLRHRMPELLQSRRPAISRADVGGHTWWRLRTGSFGGTADATGFCDKVKAKGGACDVIRS